MTVIGIAALVCVVFWSLFLIYGLVSCSRGQGDLTWWVWPPLLFAFLPFLLRNKLGEERVDLIIVSLNGALLFIALGMFLWDKKSKKVLEGPTQGDGEEGQADV